MEEAFFEYLDELKEAGIPESEVGDLLEEDFGISHQEAQRILLAWRKRNERV